MRASMAATPWIAPFRSPLATDLHFSSGPKLAARRHNASHQLRISRIQRPAMTKKLLVIDDQAGINAIVGRIAAALGLETMALRDPLKAIETFIDFAPDVVLLDMIMPEKDGIELLDEMMLTGQPAKFIVMSGYGDAYLRLAQGVATFHGTDKLAVLRKPFRREELEGALCSALGIGQTPAA
jgi:CheY-like chemotaxis protein